jgi:hypothetical protein
MPVYLLIGMPEIIPEFYSGISSSKLEAVLMHEKNTDINAGDDHYQHSL